MNKPGRIIRSVEHIIDRTPALDRYLSDLKNTNTERLSEYHRLVVENHSLAMAIVMQYGYQSQRIEDLLGAGMLGLCIAAKRFDPSKDCAFSTYAAQWIRKMIAEQLSLDAHPIHIPARMEQLRRQVVREQERFLATNGYDATPEDVAETLCVELEQVQSVWLSLDFTTSLSRSVGSDDDDSYTLADTIPDNAPTDLEEMAAIHEKIERILDHLSPQQREILIRYYYNGEDFQTIGRAMNLTATRIRQIHRFICPF